MVWENRAEGCGECAETEILTHAGIWVGQETLLIGHSGEPVLELPA